MKVKTTEWVRLSEFPSAGEYNGLNDNTILWWRNFTGGQHSGVYQVSLTKPKEHVHKDICYIGKSDTLPKRISDLRTCAGQGNKVTHHMCGVYIREEMIAIDDVYVRCLFDENKDEFERYLQNQHKNKFGYKLGYLWEEASGGHKSARINIQASIKRLSSLESIEKIERALKAQKKFLKENLNATLAEWVT